MKWVVQQHHLCTDWMSDVVNRGGDPCEQVTSIRVTSDDRENKRRIEEEARRQELRGKLLAEAEHRFAYLLSHEVIRHGKIVYGATGDKSCLTFKLTFTQSSIFRIYSQL